MSAAQVREFHERGFVALEALVAGDAMEAIRAAASRIVDDFDVDSRRPVFSARARDRDRGRDQYFMESAEAVHCFLEEDAVDPDGKLLGPKELAVNKIGHALHDLVPEFTAFCRLPPFVAALRQIGCRRPMLWQTMYLFKQPRIGGEVRWHQDASYLITDPPGVTGVWIALEDASRDNGCLWMQPGGHRSPLREIYEVDPGTGKGRLREIDTTPWPALDEAVALELPAGSVVLFHSRMPHRSSQNRSRRSRHAFTMHVADSGARWSRKNWLQRPTLGAFRL